VAVRYVSWTSLLCVVVLAGCASSAPPLPRHVSRVQEPGFTGAQVASGTASNTLVVGSATWEKLSLEQQRQVTARKTVKILQGSEYGLVADIQSADQSTPATYGGAALGSGAAQALYIGRALDGGSYTPAMHLAVGLLGGVAGSALDSQAVQKHTHRYTIQLGNGEVQYLDETKSSQFRHSIGVCVTVPGLDQLSQKVCLEGPEELTARLLSGPSAQGSASAVRVTER